MPTLFDVLVALFERQELEVLERFPEAMQDLVRAGLLTSDRN